MTNPTPMTPYILYLIICGAPPAKQTPTIVTSLQQTGWDVYVVATPQGSRWIDQSAIEALTQHTVRTNYKLSGEGNSLPKADAMLVMPATFNTINKWAMGISDTLVTGLLCEALGRGTPPILAIPCLKMDLVRHPAFVRSVTFLRECGIRILHEPERYPSPLMVPWQEIVDTLYEMMETRS